MKELSRCLFTFFTCFADDSSVEEKNKHKRSETSQKKLDNGVYVNSILKKLSNLPPLADFKDLVSVESRNLVEMKQSCKEVLLNFLQIYQILSITLSNSSILLGKYYSDHQLSQYILKANINLLESNAKLMGKINLKRDPALTQSTFSRIATGISILRSIKTELSLKSTDSLAIYLQNLIDLFLHIKEQLFASPTQNRALSFRHCTSSQ